ncbi:MAG TPA: type 1 glutamine amidotransferase [Caulobacteraceae bacterium]|nr:type 1 glutamine amidotransferase [Caulobacteraceae bacterium]
MKIGVLETGAPPKDLQPRFGRYPSMFETLIGPDAFTWASYDVRRGVFPASPEECAGYIVTGSAAGVYDPEPWIEKTEAFLRAAKGRAALVGVCFGHQLMAQAFGGKAVKSEKGWGIGLHRYGVESRKPWMDAAASVAAPASHQDQVVAAPPGASVVASCEFTPIGALAWDDGSAISIQLHPEFDPAYARALIETRGADGRYAPGQAEKAIASLEGPNDRERLGRWIGDFLKRSSRAP